MRDINLSKENVAIQRQYVKRNLRELGVMGNFDDFERRTQLKLQKIIQDDIDKEFVEQIVGSNIFYSEPFGNRIAVCRI